MSVRSLVLFSAIAFSSTVSVACGDDTEGGPSGTGGASGSGGSSGSEDPKCKVNPDPSAAPVSFKDDVLPVFGFSCAGSSCHSVARPKASLFLGPKCDPKDGKCIYPDQPNTENPSAGQPLTQADVDKVFDQLMLPSVTAPAVKRVAPNDPDNSFLVDKIANIHNDKGLTCQNTENNPEVGPCGQNMPYTGGPLCGPSGTSATGQARVDTIVNWIAQGAKKE